MDSMVATTERRLGNDICVAAHRGAATGRMAGRSADAPASQNSTAATRSIVVDAAVSGIRSVPFL